MVRKMKLNTACPQDGYTQIPRAKFPQLFEKYFWFEAEETVFLPVDPEDTQMQEDLVYWLNERNVKSALKTSEEDIVLRNMAFQTKQKYPKGTLFLQVNDPESIFNLYTNFFFYREKYENFYYSLPKKAQKWYEERNFVLDDSHGESSFSLSKEHSSVLNRTSQNWYKARLKTDDGVRQGVITPFDRISEDQKKHLVRMLDEKNIDGVIVDAYQHKEQVPRTVIFIPHAYVPKKTETVGDVGAVSKVGDSISISGMKEYLEHRKARQDSSIKRILQRIFNINRD